MNKADNTAIFSGGESIAYMPVPALPPATTPPASIYSIAIVSTAEGSDIMRIVIKRDLSMPIKSLTFRYRFSSMPIYAPDSEHSFGSFRYAEEDINTSAEITVSGNVPEGLKYNGCSAYISEIVLLSGQSLTFEAGQYKYIRRPVKKPAAAATASTASAEDKAPAPNPVTDYERQKKKNMRRAVILAVLAFMLIIEAIGGVFLYRYLGVRNSVDALMKEARFNEAYKIALDSDYDGLLQRVCEKASLHYFSEGDLESSYVYAYGAPKRFTDMIMDYAAASVIDPDTGKINETALRVAKTSENSEKFDSIIHTVIGILESRGDFTNALKVASELRSDEDRKATEDTIFNNAFSFFSNNHRYSDAAWFIDEIENINTVKRAKADVIKNALECFSSLGDNAGIIYLSHKYPTFIGTVPSNTAVEPDDAGVRAELAIVYPMLSAEQKRSYHSKSIAIWNSGAVRIKNGAIPGIDVKNAVSVDTNARETLILTKNGSVKLVPHKGVTPTYTIPDYKDVVAIALGEAHAVLLHENGTVSVHGDNTYSQANTAEWTNIAAIAAGQRFTVGLKTDGTVVAAGSNSCGQCNTAAWRNVVDVAACNQSTVLLFSDGTVEVIGYRSLGLSDIEALTDVKRIEAGGASIVAERADGTYELYSGQSGGNPGDPYNWRAIGDYDVGLMCIAGIDRSDVVYIDGDGIPS